MLSMFETVCFAHRWSSSAVVSRYKLICCLTAKYTSKLIGEWVFYVLSYWMGL